MTRRGLLTLIPAAAAVKNSRGAEPAFHRIDTHTHIHRTSAALLSSMEKAGWKCLSIGDSRAVGDEPSILPEMIRGTAEASRESKGRISWAATFDPRGFEDRDFARRTIEQLRQCFDQGAIAVKIWKNIGMAIRSKSGEYLMPDNPAFTPIFEAVQRAGKTLIAHLADPNVAWMALDPANPDSGYFRSHPEWHVYAHPGAPSKETILTARDRVLARHPGLRMIGCHLGSNEEDLSRLSKRLDAYPNLAVDLAARVRYFMREDPAKVRQFLLKYVDRILYATDFTLGNGNDEAAAKSLAALHQREWDYFSGSDMVEYRDRRVPGLALPENALRKIFHDNAVRWLPGISA